MSAGISILDYLHFDNPTIEQKNALIAMSDFVKEDNKDDFLILCGAAGTGKTSITSALIGYLNQSATQYRIAAPTGRAARILGRKTNAQNSTIHSMIYNADANPETGIVKFILKHAESEDFCVFIVDEASMINAVTSTQENSLFIASDSLLNDLVKYIKSGNKRNKLLLLGDRNQLPPVNEKDSYALMPDFLTTKYGWNGNFHLLTEVKRQEDGSYILKNATNISNAIGKGLTQYNVEAPYYAFQYAVNKYVEDYKNLPADSCISIGCTHNSNQYFNDMVRTRLYGDKPPLIIAGDLMLVTQKWSRNGQELFNGDHVVVEEILLNQIDT
ncbi:MAG TPA: AAA family ATPase, partial [Bacteroidia bacterium]|nr:AAA family ATPase [Bacteroidia bacterium]